MSKTRFTSFDNGREIAYRWLSRSSGPTLVHAPGAMVPIEVLEEDPPYERFLRTLGRYGSVVVYDFLGKGASDPFDSELDFVDQNADCFAAVVDACDLESAWLVVGEIHGGPLVRRVVVRHPGRLRGAAVLNPPGTRRNISVDTALARDDASNEHVLRNFMPSRAEDPAYRAWHERDGRLGARRRRPARSARPESAAPPGSSRMTRNSLIRHRSCSSGAAEEPIKRWSTGGSTGCPAPRWSPSKAQMPRSTAWTRYSSPTPSARS